jgi:hypothetical protein
LPPVRSWGARARARSDSCSNSAGLKPADWTGSCLLVTRWRSGQRANFGHEACASQKTCCSSASTTMITHGAIAHGSPPLLNRSNRLARLPLRCSSPERVVLPAEPVFRRSCGCSRSQVVLASSALEFDSLEAATDSRSELVRLLEQVAGPSSVTAGVDAVIRAISSEHEPDVAPSATRSCRTAPIRKRGLFSLSIIVQFRFDGRSQYAGRESLREVNAAPDEAKSWLRPICLLTPSCAIIRCRWSIEWTHCPRRRYSNTARRPAIREMRPGIGRPTC